MDQDLHKIMPKGSGDFGTSFHQQGIMAWLWGRD